MATLCWAYIIISLVPLVLTSQCYNPSGPFQAPVLQADNNALVSTFRDIENNFQNAMYGADPPFNVNTTSFAIEVTSAEQTVWGHYYTAPLLGNHTDSEPTRVNLSTAFRIASISKVFTVLAVLLQEKAGHLNLRDPITNYITDLRSDQNDEGIRWEDITLESLASQLSGIPREYGQSDMADELTDKDLGFDDPIAIGLPPTLDNDTAHCATNRQTAKPCSRKEIINGFKSKPQMFAPNAKATYSNIAFIMLGIALENITGKSYEDLANSLFFRPLGMQISTLRKPRDSDGIIPHMKNDWGANLGAYDPTGGIYSSSSDLSIFLRSIMTHTMLDIPTTNAWLKPRSYSSSEDFAYGMPWEIFRSTSLLSDSDRAMDLIMKSGSLSGYASRIIMIPEYNIGVTVLVAGDGKAKDWIEELVMSKLIPEVESETRRQMRDKYAGTYYAPAHLGVNSSVKISLDGASGLVITSWISNDTDFLHQYAALSMGTGKGRAQLVPSNIGRGSSGQVWRVMFAAPDTRTGRAMENCLIDDLDSMMYGGRSLEEFVFHLSKDGVVESVELPAFRITLQKGKMKEEGRGYRDRDRFFGFMKPFGVF